MYIICQNNQYLSYFCVILFICKMRAEGIKNSAHLDKCVTAKTVHYFKNRDKIICNKHQSGVIEPFSPVTWIGGKMAI